MFAIINMTSCRSISLTVTAVMACLVLSARVDAFTTTPHSSIHHSPADATGAGVRLMSAAIDSATGGESISRALEDFDYEANDKIPWMQSGYDTWKWRGNDINYIEMGDRSKPAIVLIHGFGASAYHWRYNLPVLARDYHVFAFCMLGFGLSSKPMEDYTPELWRDQTTDFLQQIVGKPAVLAGNSLGGFTALYTSAYEKAKPLVSGCVLLNGAGKFREPETEATNNEDKENPIMKKISAAFQRLVIGASFIYTKQPARIEQILRQVYPVNPDNVDQELVDAIQYPSFHPNAAEVFYRVISRTSAERNVFVDDLVDDMDCPLLLAWGDKDPWIRPQAADRIQAAKPTCQRVNIDAGHCPHDEAPEAVNQAIKDFMLQV